MESTVEQIVNSAEVGDNLTIKDIFSRLDQQQISLFLQSTSRSGLTPLLAATKHGQLQTVRLLVETYGAGINDTGTYSGPQVECTFTGVTPLWLSVHTNQVCVMDYLLQKSADVNLVADAYGSALSVACAKGYLDIVQTLVMCGARLDTIRACDGATNLMLACTRGHRSVSEFLLDNGAPVEGSDDDDMTALHMAANFGSVDIVKRLVELGASSPPDMNGLTPLLLAASSHKDDVVKYFLSQNDDVVAMADKIEALEVLGAAWLAASIAENSAKAIIAWKQAIELREKHHLLKCNIASVITKYRGYKEIETLERLQEVSGDSGQMYLQAALMFERILGPAHPEGIKRYHPLTSLSIWKVAEKFARVPQLLSFKFYPLWYYSLCLCCENVSPNDVGIHQRLEALTVCTASVLDRSDLKGQVGFLEVLNLFEKAVQEIRRCQEKLDTNPPVIQERVETLFTNSVIMVTSAVQLMALASRIMPKATEKETDKFKSVIKSLVELNPRGAFDQTLLQLVTSQETINFADEPIKLFPCEKCTQLLLEAGAQY